jgi:hypothetical protein
MKKKYETPSIVETISEEHLVEKASVTVAQIPTD